MQRFISASPKSEILIASKVSVDALLDMNSCNRRIRETWVEYFRDQAKKGDLILTNQGIGVDVDGVLIDGQHRLTGIQRAGYPAIPILVVYGLPRAARASIDIGINRTAADVLHFAFDRPEATSALVAATRSWGICVMKYDQKSKIPPAIIYEWYMEIGESLRSLLTIPNSARISGAMLCAAAHRIYKHPEDDSSVRVFLDGFISGADLAKDSPILRLREWVKANPATGKKGQVERFERTVAALTAHLEGRKLSKLFARNDSLEILNKTTKAPDGGSRLAEAMYRA